MAVTGSFALPSWRTTVRPGLVYCIMMTNPQPVGLFGGTFDPIHFGHLRAASEVRALLDLPDLRLLPSGHPPHRNATVASAQDRLAMIRLAVENYSDLIIDDRELRRKGRSYMVDTLGKGGYHGSEFGECARHVDRWAGFGQFPRQLASLGATLWPGTPGHNGPPGGNPSIFTDAGESD